MIEQMICVEQWVIAVFGGLLIGFGYLLNSGNKQIKEQIK